MINRFELSDLIETSESLSTYSERFKSNQTPAFLYRKDIGL
jgi:hypothetical protein